MNFDQQFDIYRQTSETLETLFTILAYQLTPNQLCDLITDKLKLVKEMRPSKKKQVTCQRLNQFIDYLNDDERSEIKEINSIFLISDTVIELPLQSDWIQVIQEYNIGPFIYKYGTSYEIDYLKLLLTDVSFKEVILVNNHEYSHIHLGLHKKKIHYHKTSKNFNLKEYVEQKVETKCVIHGVAGILKGFKCESPLQHWVITHKLTDEEIFELYRKDAVEQIHEELKKYLSYMENTKLIHRLVFGKLDIQKKIAQKALQTLFCSPDKYQTLIKRLPAEYQTNHFKIYSVETLSPGDLGDRLKNDFSGLFGVTYY